MRKKALVCLCAALLVLLCSCGSRGYIDDLAGVWQGDGTMDYAPLMGARVLSFDGNVLTVDFGAMEEKYEVSATDDTLTITSPSREGGFGLAYEIKGDELILCSETEFIWIK